MPSRTQADTFGHISLKSSQAGRAPGRKGLPRSLRGFRRQRKAVNRRAVSVRQIIMRHLAEAKRHIGDEMGAGKHIQDRKFRDISHRMGKQLERCRAAPCPFQRNILPAIAHKLANPRAAIDMRDDLDEEIRLRRVRAGSGRDRVPRAYTPCCPWRRAPSPNAACRQAPRSRGRVWDAPVSGETPKFHGPPAIGASSSRYIE